MIIKSKSNSLISSSRLKLDDPDCDLIEWKTKPYSSELKITQAQEVDSIIAHSQMMKKETRNGFTKKRSMRILAEIPSLLFAKYSNEWLREPNKERKWLKSEEAEPFLFVNKHSI